MLVCLLNLIHKLLTHPLSQGRAPCFATALCLKPKLPLLVDRSCPSWTDPSNHPSIHPSIHSCIHPAQHSSCVIYPTMSLIPWDHSSGTAHRLLIPPVGFFFFFPQAACISVQALHRGFQPCWFPGKGIRGFTAMLSHRQFLIYVHMGWFHFSPALLIAMLLCLNNLCLPTPPITSSLLQNPCLKLFLTCFPVC